jgi:ferrochelatase
LPERDLPYDAILLVGFGGPEGPEDVLPFLQNVTRGRGIPPERLAVVGRHYDHFGGVSPINEQNRALRAALAAELDRREIDLPVLWGNRNWSPYLADALRDADGGGRAGGGPTRLLALVTSAYSSYSSCRQYREDLADALAATGLGDRLRIDRIRQYFDHPGFIEPAARGLAEALRAMRADLASAPGGGRIEVLFTTHSIPTLMAESSGAPPFGGPGASAGGDVGTGGVYERQHLAAAALIAEAAARLLGNGADGNGADGDRAGGNDVAAIDRDRSAAPTPLSWRLVYQSRSGPPSVPWLEPDVNDAIAALAADGAAGVVLVPSGFVSDHIEVRWDLDEEARDTAAQHGLAFARVPTAGADPQFVAAMVDLIEERLDPARPVEALSALGPWPAVCPAGCCPNPHVRKPAAAGSDNGAVVSRADDGAASVEIG